MRFRIPKAIEKRDTIPGSWIKFQESYLLLALSQFHIVEFLNRETELWETKKPPAMRVVKTALAYSIKPPVLQ